MHPLLSKISNPLAAKKEELSAAQLIGAALSGAVFMGVVGLLAFGMGVALNALELLVAGLQAYVFAILTCVYLNDALHPSH